MPTTRYTRLSTAFFERVGGLYLSYIQTNWLGEKLNGLEFRDHPSCLHYPLILR